MIVGPVALGIGIVALVIALARTSKAVPPEPYIPTTDEILASPNFSQLECYYDLAGELYTTGIIDHTTYEELYDAYSSRYYELLEAG